jgi:hypothetical protein
MPDLTPANPAPSDPTAFDINNFSTSDTAGTSAPSDTSSEAGDASTTTGGDVNSARDAVEQAISGSPSSTLDPIAALNAQAVNLPLGSSSNDVPNPAGPAPDINVVEPEQSSQVTDPNAPPPVPPPMMPPTNPY